MLRMDESDDKSAGIEEKNSEWWQYSSSKGHFQLSEVVTRLIISFPLAERKIFEMQIFNELVKLRFTFEG